VSTRIPHPDSSSNGLQSATTHHGYVIVTSLYLVSCAIISNNCIASFISVQGFHSPRAIMYFTSIPSLSYSITFTAASSFNSISDILESCSSVMLVLLFRNNLICKFTSRHINGRGVKHNYFVFFLFLIVFPL